MRRLAGPRHKEGGSVQALLSHSEPRAHWGKEEGRPGLSPWGQDLGEHSEAGRELNKEQWRETGAHPNTALERDWGAPQHSSGSSVQYDNLSRMVKEFQPYLDLWTTASDWLRWSESWMNDPLSAIDAEQLEKNVIESFKTMHKCVKQFKDIPGRQPSQPVPSCLACASSLSPLSALPTACQEVALDIRTRIEEFKPYIPLIQGLRNPGMRNRHWDMLSNEININVRPKANLTFARCLEMNLQDHIESISKVAEVAGKEYTIEQVGSH